MVLDISLFRSSDNVKIIKESHAKRYGDPSLIDEIITSDSEWRKVLFKREKISMLKNMIKKAIGNKKSKKDKTSTNEQKTNNFDEIVLDERIVSKIPDLDKSELDTLSLEELLKLNAVCNTKLDEVKLLEDKTILDRDLKLKCIGNILHESVPFGPDDDSNIIIYSSPIPNRNNNNEVKEKVLHHYELLPKICGVDYKAGSEIAGNRGYFLKGACVFLGQALQQLSLHLLDEKNYTAVQTPYFMKEEIMASVAQLSQFDEELYKVIGTNSEDNDNTKYLIATSEQPLTALHCGEKFPEKSLPIKYAGISTCFRKEAGRRGKDTSGIFRVHQFEKVEQFIICSSENNESWNYLEEMLMMSRSLLDLLEIPYRVVNIASGELNLAASKKYDIEGWFPGSCTYRELVSCSNCTDYHSRNLGIKHNSKSDNSGKYVYMLNATMCAVTRMICIILENYQTVDGIKVPTALQPYMPQRYKNLIPYVEK
jgi:seryl-tRNA synthetase